MVQEQEIARKILLHPLFPDIQISPDVVLFFCNRQLSSLFVSLHVEEHRVKTLSAQAEVARALKNIRIKSYIKK